MKNDTEPVWLVTGASGNLGRASAKLLLQKSGARIIAGSRDTSKLTDLAAEGAELRTVDFDHPETLATAFAGVDRVLLISTDAVLIPGQRLTQHRAAIKAAEAAGVTHIAYTSTVNAVEGSALLVAPDHLGTEHALEQSSFGYTVLRNNYYADNLLPALVPSLKGGKWFAASGDGKISFVSRDDCAAAAAEAIASDFNGRRTLEITGPEALTYQDVAALVVELTGRSLEVVQVPVEGLIAGIQSSGLPEEVARLIASFDQAAALGALSVVTTTVSDLSGRPPETLRDFLARNRSVLA